jgi:hypothetical protein
MDTLTFCVSNNSDFIYDKPCPKNDCKFRNFWSSASENFARKATGSVLLVLNGTRGDGAVVNTSTFYLHELQQFKSDKIKRLEVMLLHRPNQPKYETCANGKSIKALQAIIEARNISFVCTDDPVQLLFYMCFEDFPSPECNIFNRCQKLFFDLRFCIFLLIPILNLCFL